MTSESSPSVAAASAPAPSSRLHAIDACRAAAMLLGIALHAALPYLTHAPGAFDDPADSAWLTAAIHVIHSFRLPLFFLLAGFFAALLIDRRGVRPMLANRGARLGIPLLLGMLFLSPLCALAYAYAAGELEYVTPRGLLGEVTGFWHMWFLRDLLILVAAAAGVAIALPRAFLARLAGPLSKLTLRPLVGLIPMTLLVALTLFIQPWWGLRGEGTLPHWQNLVHHGLWFAFGAAVYPHRTRLPALAKQWWFLALLVPPAVGVHLALVHRMEELGGFSLGSIAEEPLLLAIVVRVSYAAMAAVLVLASLAAFLRFAASPSRAARYVSDASYWAYLVHYPLVLAAGRLILPLDLPAEAKVLLNLAMVCPVIVLSYELFVRRTVLGRVLNGPAKKPEPLPAPASPPGGRAAATPA